ncbi:MAG TPA: FAD-binding protein, partial [Solirubrobacteraceae bacterium]|nr:FAD-binding protein [Solirubrobacteraceae bacterium]
MTARAPGALERELKTLLGAGAVLPGTSRAYLSDATESRNLKGRADAIALPGTADQVAETVAWCYARDVPVIPRGGGTGFTGGAVPMNGGVVLSLERINKMRHLDPGLWRAAAEAGMITADLRRRARENGLFYPPDPGSGEQSQLGGNIATNAGGPHAFKYGVTGAWVTGLEVVLAPGELVGIGGPIRKDVAGYDLKSLLIGSEGTLGVVTAAWVKLIPAPEAALPLAAFYEDTQTGCAGIEAALASGVTPAALEYLDAGAVKATKGAFPAQIPDEAQFMVIADADGSAEEAARIHAELQEVLTDHALLVHAPTETREINALWRWRDGASHAVTAQR